MSNEILAALVAFALGIIGMIISNTAWFSNQISRQISSQISEPITTNQLERNISRAKWIAGTIFIVVPITIIIMSLLTDNEVRFLNEQLQAYEQSEDWQLPKTLLALGEASKSLNLSASERKQFEEQKNELDEANTKIALLETEIEQNKTKISSLESLIQVSGEEFELVVGKTQQLVQNSAYVRLKAVYSSWVSVNVDGVDKVIDIGKSVPVYVGDISCELFLVDIEDSKAKFNFVCEN